MDDKRPKSHGSWTLSSGFRKSGEDFSDKKSPYGSSQRPDRSPALFSVSTYIKSFLLLLLVPSLVFCREALHMAEGRVIDASTNRGLPSASVLVENTDYHTSTNANGQFGVPLPSSGSRLIVTYVGYKTETIEAVPDRSPIVIRLTPVGYAVSEVTVEAENKMDEIQNSFRLGSAQIKDLAVTLGDPMRSLQTMPGASSDNEMSAQINVRGGTSDENLVLINGAPIYRPYHLNELSMSSVGIFNMDLVKSIRFSAGGWSAKYGNALSSIINVDYKEGNRNHFIGTADLGVTDMSASLQGPINQNGSFIVAARTCYLGYLLQRIKLSQGINAGYYDVQGNIGYDFSASNKLRVTFIDSRDNASQDPTNSTSTAAYPGTIVGKSTLITETTSFMPYDDDNYSTFLLSVNSDNLLSDELISRTSAYYSRGTEHRQLADVIASQATYDTFPGMWSSQSTMLNSSDDLDLERVSLHQELQYQATSFLNFDAGLGVERIWYDYSPKIYESITRTTNTVEFPDTTVSSYLSDDGSTDTVAVVAPSYAVAGYAQETLQILDNLKLNLGVRFDYFDLDKEDKFSPRVGLSYMMPFEIGMSAAWGIYYQLPDYDQLRSSQASAGNTRFQRATHYVLDLEKHFLGVGVLDLDFYQKYYSDLIPAIRSAYGSLSYGDRQNDGVGFAKGMDVAWSMNLKNIDISFSYSYLVAKEKTPGTDEGYYPRITDQRNTASIAVSCDLGDEWIATAKGFYGSGYAYTPSVTRYDSSIMMDVWVESGKNSAHYPPYERVDLRITKTVSIMQNPLRCYLEVTNVLNRRNVLSYDYTYDKDGNPKMEPTLLLGIVPTIGISYTFGL